MEQTNGQTQEQKHLQVLINATLMAQRRGAFDLLETPDIYAAVKYFTTAPAEIQAKFIKKEQTIELP